MRLTILFDDPYWIGLLEMERDGRLFAARHIFGAEPSDAEVYEFVQRELLALQAQMTVGVSLEKLPDTERRINPKRAFREARRAVAETGIGTKAQEAMKRQIEANQTVRIEQSKTERDAERERKRAIAVAKAKAKHRGH